MRITWIISVEIKWLRQLIWDAGRIEIGEQRATREDKKTNTVMP